MAVRRKGLPEGTLLPGPEVSKTAGCSSRHCARSGTGDGHAFEKTTRGRTARACVSVAAGQQSQACEAQRLRNVAIELTNMLNASWQQMRKSSLLFAIAERCICFPWRLLQAPVKAKLSRIARELLATAEDLDT